MSVLETVSENRKRGRPRQYDLRTSEALGAFCEIKTERGKQNRENAIVAMGVLRRHPKPDAFHWLYDPSEVMAGKQTLPFGILTELGRIYAKNEDDHEIHQLAETLCREKPKGKDAVRWLRRYRLGERKGFSVLALTDIIGNAINGYTANHPETTPKAIRAALQNVSDLVVEKPKRRDATAT